MRLPVIICFVSLVLLSCGGEEPYHVPARKAATVVAKPEFEPNDSQTVFRYEPVTSYINGTIRKEGHNGRRGHERTPHVDLRDSVYVVELDHRIRVLRDEQTDVLSHDRDNVLKMQITSRSDTLRKYAGKKVQIKGLLMEDTTPASYYDIVMIVQGIKLK